ncbi:CLUMA_CG017527, isoform A [Clunio marinus]|uniref:Mitochondrial import receptor subunit TOM22 homolog n=1 Tax=Clunio marinus TaxID=568069 RepID=A0A1J1IXJ8_9DIPT|nr:CLUMA_CG017527, isoform A [Clunio marinus]
MDNSIEFLEIEKDSGMESVTSSKDETPERKNEIIEATDEYEDEPDETLGERLWGLTEMFPDPVRNVTESAVDLSVRTVVSLYKFACASSWIFFTSSMILFAPVLFETERAQMEEMQKSQQKQVLLGTGPTSNMPPIPR